MKKIIIYIIEVFFYYIFRVFPIQKNKIFFQNYNGKGYGDNPKYIAEEILRGGYDLNLVWAVRRKYKGNIPKKIKTVPYFSIRAIYESATAKIWIDNCRKQLYAKKRKGQYYIQTWHGTINFKKVEKDVENKLSNFYVKHAKYDSIIADLFLSDSKFTSQLYRSSFWYNGEILECGTPREDILINQNQQIKEKVRKYFNISENTNIILYAPTFRNNFNTSIFDINYNLILNNLQEQTNKKWVFLLRMHPNDSKKSGVFTYNNLIYNASDYDDMQEILMSSDILITDYSDCMYEFALMNKPVFLYIKDYEQYKIERDFYFDISSMPFPSAVNNDDLLQKIINFNTVFYFKTLNDFFMKVGVFKEGNASKIVVNKIMEKINDNS